jgi:hypothetical protein
MHTYFGEAKWRRSNGLLVARKDHAILVAGTSLLEVLWNDTEVKDKGLVGKMTSDSMKVT